MNFTVYFVSNFSKFRKNTHINKRRIHRLIIFAVLVILLIPSFLLAQSFPDLKFRHLTVANGLPAKYVMFTYKDSQNLLWIGTVSNGVVRYDGKNYKTFVEKFNNHSGFYGMSAEQIIEDSLHNLWIGSTKCLNHFIRENEKIEHLYYQKPTNSNENYEDYTSPNYIDNQSRLWFYSANHQKLLTYSLKTKEIEVKTSGPDYLNERSIFYPRKLYQPVELLLSTQRQSGFRIVWFKNGEISYYKDYFNKGNKSFPEANIERSCVIQNPENLWLNADLGMIGFNAITEKYVIYKHFRGQDIGVVQFITALDERYLLVGTNSNGIYVFDTAIKQFVHNIRHLDSDPESIYSNAITTISCDKSKNIFVSFVGGGAIDIASWNSSAFGQFISRQTTEQFQTNNHFKFIQEISANKFWCVNSDNKILEWNSATNQLSEPAILREFNKNSYGKEVNQIYLDDQHQIWILTNKELFVKSPKGNDLKSVCRKTDARSIVQVGIGKYLFTTPISIFLLKQKNASCAVEDASKKQENRQREMSDIHFDSRTKQVFIKCEWGQNLLQMQLEGDSLKLIKLSVSDRRPSMFESICLKENNTILIPSIDGLYEYDIQKNLFNKRCSQQVADNDIRSVVQYDAKTIYALSNNVLLKIKIPSWQSSKVELPIMGSSKENLIYSSLFCGSDKNIYLVSNNGIVKYNPTLKNNVTNPPQIYISDIEINGKQDSTIQAPNHLNLLVLGPEVNNTDIFISNLNFSGGNSLANISYQIKNFDNSLQAIEANGRIHINKLPAGEFSLNIVDTDNDKILKTIKITVEPHWYQTMLFKLALFTFFVIIGLILFMVRVNTIRQEAKTKSDYENKMIHLEMQNLRSQMNPHFIFNSLNSINSFVVQNKTHLASDYLTKFSRLIRLILDNSKNEKISLEKEIETLRLYLLMESLRFDQKFDYQITVDEQIDEQSIKMPPMIIQPFVENAIWHGLLHKTSKGKVEILIAQTAEALVVTILDDGIGRKKAAELNSKNSTNRKSYGMEITGQRIKYLNPKNTVMTSDLIDEHGVAMGTKIELCIYF